MKASAVGRQAPRPRPARNLRVVNWATFCAKATARVRAEKTAMQLIRVIRRPNLSVSGPTATAPIPTPIRPTVEAVVREASVNPRSPVFDRVGITAPMTTRSNPSRAKATQHSRTGQKDPDPTARDAGETSVLVDDEDIRCSLPREECPCTVAGVARGPPPTISVQ